MAESSPDELDLVLKTAARTIVDNAEYFAHLDSIVGDGDFGYSLRNGWEVVLSDYDTWDHSNAGAVLKKVGVTLAGKVGGVSGPIWGTAFLRAGATAGDKTELSPEDVIAILRAAIAGIMARGGVAPRIRASGASVRSTRGRRRSGSFCKRLRPPGVRNTRTRRRDP